jgi:hypothetical protein
MDADEFGVVDFSRPMTDPITSSYLAGEQTRQLQTLGVTPFPVPPGLSNHGLDVIQQRGGDR